MIIRVLKKYQLEIVAFFGAVLFFAFGFLVGKGQKEKVPVFITKEPTTSAVQTEAPVDVESKEQPDEVERAEIVSEYTEMTVVATAYCPCEICCGEWALTRPVDEYGEPIIYTASGERATQGRTIAVDPDVIPLGTEVIINGQTYVAQDTGSAVVGNHIDIFFSSHEEACQFGRQEMTVIVKE